jgi:5-methyltetrahydrofolate--homocysteine methyltransferase
MAKKYMMDPAGFEAEGHAEQLKMRQLYEKGAEDDENGSVPAAEEASDYIGRFDVDTFLDTCPPDIAGLEVPASEILPYFDWRMFYAIWGVKYGSSSPEAMELMQLRQDAEDELALGNFKIMVSAKFMMGCSDGVNIISEHGRLPFMRQNDAAGGLSLCDFVVPQSSGKCSPFGIFTICVKPKNSAHEEGCCCPACSNKYEDMVAKAVRMTLAEAASKWLDTELTLADRQGNLVKVIKPAAGYSSCPDHTLKGDVVDMLSGRFSLGIKLTESYAMIPEASICGFIFMHPQAKYPEIRKASKADVDAYAQRRGMDAKTADRFLSHLIK